MHTKNRSRETLEMGTGKPTVGHTFNPNGHCGDYLSCRRAPLRLTRSVLGRHCNARSHAIDTRRDSFNFGRTHCRYRFGRFGRGGPGKLFYRKSFGLRSCGVCTGLLCAGFRMEKTAYRYASITLAIIVLIPRSNAAWIIALHRFFEVSVGIVVALAFAALWTERQPESAKQSGE
jgi:hypothetical protein